MLTDLREKLRLKKMRKYVAATLEGRRKSVFQQFLFRLSALLVIAVLPRILYLDVVSLRVFLLILECLLIDYEISSFSFYMFVYILQM